MKKVFARKFKVHLIATFVITACAIIYFLSSNILVDSRIIRPNVFIDGLINPSVWIADWIENPICKIPCWGHAVPGYTNRSQAKLLLSNNPSVTDVEESDVIPYGQVLKVNLDDDEYLDDVTIFFDNNDIVQKIELSTFGGNLYLNDMLSVYGSPRQVLVREQMYEYVTVDLLYPELGMVVELFIRNLNLDGEIPQVRIDKYEEVQDIYLMVPNFEYFFNASDIVILNRLYEWKGYAVYP
jgi:hypothetical protein